MVLRIKRHLELARNLPHDAPGEKNKRDWKGKWQISLNNEMSVYRHKLLDLTDMQKAIN